MKRNLILLSLLCLNGKVMAYESLDSVFRSLSERKNTVATEVRYSGSFSPDCGGFIFQRGDGKGWTKGVRLTVTDVSPADASVILDAFRKDDIKGGYVRKDNLQAFFDERGKTGYALRYDEESATLYMLRADVEDEICIPSDWHLRDYHYAPATPVHINWPAAAARLYTEIKYNSPFYRKAASRLERAYHEALETLEQADDYEAYRELKKLAAACGDGHTYVYATGKMNDKPVASPFTTVLLGDRLYIDHVDSDELAAAGMKRGMEVTAVNGEAPREYANRELLPYVSTSTPQWAAHLMFDGYGISTGRKGMPLNLQLSDIEEKDNIVIEYSIGTGDWNRQTSASRKPSFNITDGNTAVLTLPDFASEEIRDYFDSVYPRILESDALVIDLRSNGGGNSSHGDYILRHLSSDSIPKQPWQTPMYMPAYASWGEETRTFEYPSEKMAPVEGKKPYLGPVAVLADRGTFSAAEDFCSIFKSMKRGLIIGTPTGGSTGNSLRASLGDGLYANICSKHDYMPDGTEFVGIGIIPDIIVEPTPESYFSIPPDDMVLNRAIAALRPHK